MEFDEHVSAAWIARRAGVSVGRVLEVLRSFGVAAGSSQRLSPESAQAVLSELGMKPVFTPLFSEDIFPKDDPASRLPRPPVIAVMGHVDHGKTTLLDAIRKTSVAAKEAGGITQHIGASVVDAPGGRLVFLDTPGHEAFTALRARGAQVTDLVVLVVAADDGVMPQTLEALDHARSAGVPIVVAINKMDLPAANPQKVMQQLAERGIVPEKWGGKTIFVEVSARTGKGVDELLQMLLLQAEVMELKANPNAPASGTVIEAKMDPRRGPLATLLIQRGTLRVGDALLAGLAWGKVRAMHSDRGERISEAGPSLPVEVLGFGSVPQAGDRFRVVPSEREARQTAEERILRQKNRQAAPAHRITLEMLAQARAAGESPVFRLVLKGDAWGSVEALRDQLERFSGDQVQVRILHAGVGPVSESDVDLAAAGRGLVVGFQVPVSPRAKQRAQSMGVDVRTYRLIYEASQDIQAALEGLLEPEVKVVAIGKAQVKQIFRVPKAGMVYGCGITDGKVSRGCGVKVWRAGQVVHEGRVTSLRRFKDDVREVERPLECGIGIEGFETGQPGDVLEFLEEQRTARRLAPS